MTTNNDEFEEFQRRMQSLRNDDVNNNPDRNPGVNDAASDSDKNSVYHETENNTSMDLPRLFQAMLIENGRRDALMEKMLDKVLNQGNGTSNVNLSIMPEVLRNIKNFNGDTSHAETWIKSLKSAQLLHNLPDSYMLETARTRLTDGAHHWYVANEDGLLTWALFQAKFEDTFVVSKSMTVKWREMTNRTQKRGEQLDLYFHEKVKLCKELNLNFKETKEQILIGLWSKPMCDSLFTVKHFSIEQLLNDLREYENIEKERILRISRPHNNVPSYRQPFKKENENNVANKSNNEPTQNSALQPNKSKYLPPRNEQNKPLCFKCKKYGHVSKYCLSESTNSSSATAQPIRPPNQTGNTSNLPRQTESATHNVNLNTDQNVHDTNLKYFQQALINGNSIKAYVDLGSQCVMLRESDANGMSLSYEHLESPIRIRGFGDGAVEPLGKLTAEIQVDQAKAFTEILIIPDKFQDIPLIIGQPFTEQPHIVVLRKGNTLRIFEDDLKNENNFNVPNLPVPKVNLWAKDVSVIPPNFVGFVTVYSSEQKNGNLFIEKQTEHTRFIPRCIVELDDKGETNIPIMNITKKEINILEGEKVTRGESCAKEIEHQVNLNEIAIDRDSDELEEVNINPNLGSEDKERIVQLLREYKDCFSRGLTDLGAETKVKCEIETLDDKPVTFRPYRLSHAEREKLRLMINELKCAGIVVDSTSPYASPVLIVKKKTGDERMCIDFLGFEISGDGVKPGRNKVLCILDFPEPKTQTAVRQFLGLTSYFRRFVKNYAVLAKPLSKLLCKDVLWDWGEEQVKSFHRLKEQLSDEPILAFFNPLAYTEVHTDASRIGLAGILMQKNDLDNNMHPVLYVSRQTTCDEQKYHSSELETLSAVWTVERLRTYLIGLHFTIVTDCNALRSTFAKKNMVSRIGRWWLKLQEFDFEIIYRPGTHMNHVDALSRNPVMKPEDMEVADSLTVLVNTIDEDDWLTIAQKSDPKLQIIMESLNKTKNLTADDKRIKLEYELRDGRLFKREKDKLLWVVPKRVRWRIVKKMHDDLGHPALDKTYLKIREKYWWARLRNYIKGYIGSCIDCLYHKTPGGRQPGKLHSIDKIGIPFDTVHLDHLGPFVKSKSGFSHVLILIDGFTKFTFLRAARNTSTAVTTRIFEDIIGMVGSPRRVITDRGTAFTGAVFRKCCQDKKIIHVLNATSIPRANGQVERVNRFVTTSLASLVVDSDGKDWDRHLGKVQFGINNTIHQATKKTPFNLLLNFEPRHIDGDLLHDVLANNEPNEDVLLKRLEAFEKIKEDQEKQKRRYDKKRAKPREYNVGDLVLMRRENAATGESRKLLPKYKGPYQVMKKLPYDRYYIEDVPEVQRTQKFYKGVAAIDALKPFKLHMEEDASSDEEEISDLENIPNEKSDDEMQEDSGMTRAKRVIRKPTYLRDFV